MGQSRLPGQHDGARRFEAARQFAEFVARQDRNHLIEIPLGHRPRASRDRPYRLKNRAAHQQGENSTERRGPENSQDHHPC